MIPWMWETGSMITVPGERTPTAFVMTDSPSQSDQLLLLGALQGTSGNPRFLKVPLELHVQFTLQQATHHLTEVEVKFLQGSFLGKVIPF